MYQARSIIVYIIFTIINLIIAYTITTFLGVKDTILYQSFTATNYIITYEVIIWFLLMLCEAPLLDKLEE